MANRYLQGADGGRVRSRDRWRMSWGSEGLLFVALSVVPAAGTAVQPRRSIEALAFNCFTCHGTDGRSPGDMHSINGKSADWVRQKLHEFKAGAGNPTIMNRIAKGYSADEIARIADYIGALR